MKSNIKTISDDLTFINKIKKESNGEIIFFFDICYLINFLTICRNKSIPNHLIDMLLQELTKINPSNIIILDQFAFWEHNNYLYWKFSSIISKLPLNTNFARFNLLEFV